MVQSFVRRGLIPALYVLGLLMAGEPVWAQNQDMKSALELGKATASEIGAGVAKGITQGPQPDELMPGFQSSNPTQTEYYGNGNGDTKSAGNEKASDCAAAGSDALAGYAGKPCDAINFLRKQPQVRPDMAISKQDPLIKSADSKISAAKASGLTSGAGTQAASQPTCNTESVPGAPQYSEEVCHQDGSLKEVQCTTGQIVDVDAKYNYKCTSTPKTLEEVSCERIFSTSCKGAQVDLICPDGNPPPDGRYCKSSSTFNEAAAVNYTCPDGYTLSGSTCTKTESASASISGYTCPSGYTLGSGSTCTKTTTATATGTPVYSCPSGSTLSGSSCLSTLTQSATLASYTCPAGSTVSGSSCLSTQTTPPSVNNTCPSGYTLNGSTCQKTVSASATPVYACSTGYTLSGTTCSKQVSTSASISTYTCPSGYSLGSGSTCTKTTIQTTSGTPVYACPNSYSLVNGSCEREISNPAQVSYLCDVGYSNVGTQCFKSSESPAAAVDVVTQCPTYQGWEYRAIDGEGGGGMFPVTKQYPQYWGQNLLGYSVKPNGFACYIHIDRRESRCSPTGSGYFPADKWKMIKEHRSYDVFCIYEALKTYQCPSGTTLSGTNCISTTTTAAQLNYTCPAGYTLSGSSCTKTESASASITGYTCPSGYSLSSGSTCTKTTTATATGTPVYSCPSGSTLSGSSCLSTLTQSATLASYTCPAGSTVSGSSCLTTQTTPPSVNNTCPSGYTLNGSTCQKTVSASATPVYACAAGYTLSGTSCSKQVSTSASISTYTCPSGYSLGSGSTCTKSTTSTATGMPQYACASGYTLSGTTCSRQVSTSATANYSCRTGGTLSGQTCSYIVTTTSEADEKFSCSLAQGGELTQGAVIDGKQTYVCCTDESQNQCSALEGASK